MSIKHNLRYRFLTVVVTLLVVSNLAGLFKILLSKEHILQVYTVIPLNYYPLFAAIPVLTIMSLIALWFGKKSGGAITLLLFGIVVWLDITCGVWDHAAAATSGLVLLGAAVWKSRKHFSAHA